ncbi:hypothetical protein [Desulfocurvus sp. DL9XJH121]
MTVTSIAYQPMGYTSAWGVTPGTDESPAREFASASLRTPASEDVADAAQGFAQDLALRMAQAAQDGDKDTSTLASSLAEAMEYIGEEFGSDAATAAMGIVYSKVGQEEIDEDSLGNGLLGVIAFVDRNFGFSGGDKVISRFNGELNDSINEYFDNGLSELFYAQTPQTTSIAQAVPGLASAVSQAWGQDAADGVADMIRDSLTDGLNLTNLRRGVADAADRLEQDGAPGAAATLEQAAQEILDELNAAAQTPPGAALDVYV